MIRITDRDKEIISYVEQYGFVTISQAYNMWFSDQTYGYDLARKRLNILVDTGRLKSNKSKHTNFTNIYYIDKRYSNMSHHNILIMDVYSKITSFGGDIKYFKREQPWDDGKYRSDAYVIYTFEGYVYALFIEVFSLGTSSCNSLNTLKDKLQERYFNVMTNKEYQSINTNVLGANYDIVPNLLVVDDLSSQEDWNDLCNVFKTFHTNFSMKNLCKIIL